MHACCVLYDFQKGEMYALETRENFIFLQKVLEILYDLVDTITVTIFVIFYRLFI